MIERYKKRRMRWGQALINVTFGITRLEKAQLEILAEEANEKTGRTDIGRAGVLQDMLDHNADMRRVKPLAEKQLNKESSNGKRTQGTGRGSPQR